MSRRVANVLEETSMLSWACSNYSCCKSKSLVRDWDDLQKVILTLNLVRRSRQRNPRRSRRARPSPTAGSTALQNPVAKSAHIRDIRDQGINKHNTLELLNRGFQTLTRVIHYILATTIFPSVIWVAIIIKNIRTVQSSHQWYHIATLNLTTRCLKSLSLNWTKSPSRVRNEGTKEKKKSINERR